VTNTTALQFAVLQIMRITCWLIIIDDKNTENDN